jgi:hypothetical protein
VRAARRLGLALLGCGLGAGCLAHAGAGESDDLLEFLEFLGDEQTASATWTGFFDSLPVRPEDARVPVTARPASARPAGTQPAVMEPAVMEEAQP